MKSSAGTWTVGEVAERFDVATHVLRHWEDVGLLSPDRDAGGRRVYRQDDVVRVAAIQRNKLAGMSLPQIRVLLDGEAANRHQVLEAHLRDLDDRMTEMRRARDMTEHALRCRSHDLTTCPRFREHVGDVLGRLGFPVSAGG